MYQYLLPTMKLRRLELLNKLVVEEGQTLKLIAKRQEMTPYAVKRIIDVLNREIRDLHGIERYLKVNEFDVVELAANSPKLTKQQCFQRLKLYYL